METLEKVFKQTSWQLIGKGITAFSTVIIVGLVSRGYGEARTGEFSLALTFLGFFYLAVDFGINAYIIHSVAENKVWQKLLGLRILWAGILTASCFLLTFFWNGQSLEFKRAVFIGSLSILGYSIFVSTNALFQKMLRYELVIFSSSLSALVSVVIVFFLVYIRIELAYLLLGSLIGWIVCATTSLALIKRFVDVKPIFEFNFIKKTFKEAWPIAITLVLNVVYFRADSFIIASVKGYKDVGVYSVAYQIFQTGLVLPTFIMNGYYPLMLNSLKEDKLKFLKEVKIVSVYLLILSLLGVFTTLVLSPTLISILTGGFEGSVLSLRILSFGFPAFFLSSLLMWVFLSLKKFKILAFIYLIGLIINLMLNFIFIPQYSYIGSSWITSISEYLILVLLLITLYFNLKKYEFNN